MDKSSLFACSDKVKRLANELFKRIPSQQIRITQICYGRRIDWIRFADQSEIDFVVASSDGQDYLKVKKLKVTCYLARLK